MSRTRQVVVAQIGAAHGVKGEVRLKPFTQVPADVAAYGPLTAPDGRIFEIEASGRPPGRRRTCWWCGSRAIGDRNAAEALNSIELSVPQDRLPPTGGGRVLSRRPHRPCGGRPSDGDALGTIVGVPNYGAGDLLEIAPSAGPTISCRSPTPPCRVDVAGGRVVVDPPQGLLDDGDEDGRGP